MDIQKIENALNQAADPAPLPTNDCLRPRQLAAWMDGGLCDTEHKSAEQHLADCDFCLNQLALLLRSEDSSSTASLPASVTERAERMAVQPLRRSHGYRVWATAAVVILAVGLISIQWMPDVSAPGESPLQQTRYIDRGRQEPRLLAPDSGSMIRPVDQVFRWTPVPGSLFYDVRLVSLDGDLLLRERVDGTRWLIPQSLVLKAGEEYYVRVDAYLSDAKFLSSEHVLFTVDDDR